MKRKSSFCIYALSKIFIKCKGLKFHSKNQPSKEISITAIFLGGTPWYLKVKLRPFLNLLTSDAFNTVAAL